MRSRITLLFVFASLIVRAQPPVKLISKAQILKSVPVAGELVRALQWSDRAGTHYVVVTTTGIQEKPNSPCAAPPVFRRVKTGF